MKNALLPKTITLLTASSLFIGCVGCSENSAGKKTAQQINLDNIGLSVQGNPVKSKGGKALSGEYRPDILFKADGNHNNPLITNYFCADPTAVEYNGRLYVYGTNDNQQYREKGDSDNSYERIKSFIIISTDDMANWRFEGEINTAKIAPWIYASWAPSVVSRKEEDGLTHFYLYFSNSGAGIGVLTSTNPAGPWSDPLGKPLISPQTKGLRDCPNPFDPGVCIDANGVGWLSFGGGLAPNGSSYMPGTARIVRLGKDMISIDSEIASIPAPYFFEASELNYMNDTYVYTFNTSWEARTEWNTSSVHEAPPPCSMCYMTSKTPLDSDSWKYQGYYLKNPGELGLDYSNNHTHLEKFKGQYYLFFHTMILQKARGIDKGFRSLCVNAAKVDEENAVIYVCDADRKGTAQIKPFEPYQAVRAETSFLTDCDFTSDKGNIYARCNGNRVIGVRGVDFGKGSSAFIAKVKGKGIIEVHTDNFDSEPSSTLSFDCADWTAVYDVAGIKGSHDIFFIMSGDFYFDEWQFLQN